MELITKDKMFFPFFLLLNIFLQHKKKENIEEEATEEERISSIKCLNFFLFLHSYLLYGKETTATKSK